MDQDATPSRSSLSHSGIINHSSRVEATWTAKGIASDEMYIGERESISSTIVPSLARLNCPVSLLRLHRDTEQEEEDRSGQLVEMLLR